MDVVKVVDLSPDRVQIERTDNGVILVDIGEKNQAETKMVYEIWNKEGNIDFFKVAELFYDIAEYLKIPVDSPELNTKLEIYVEKFDPEKPFPGEKPEEEDEDEDE